MDAIKWWYYVILEKHQRFFICFSIAAYHPPSPFSNRGKNVGSVEALHQRNGHEQQQRHPDPSSGGDPAALTPQNCGEPQHRETGADPKQLTQEEHLVDVFRTLYLCIIYIYMYIYTYICICLYIYIYVSRSRDIQVLSYCFQVSHCLNDVHQLNRLLSTIARSNFDQPPSFLVQPPLLSKHLVATACALRPGWEA